MHLRQRIGWYIRGRGRREQSTEGDVVSCIQSNIQHFGHFHTAGVPGRHELDETQELYYPAIMRAIAATNYSGYVGQELIPKGDALAALENSYKICDVLGKCKRVTSTAE